MMNKRLTFILFFIFFATTLNAQKFELGKVTIEELQQKAHPLDTSAVAAVLFNKGVVVFEYDQNEGFTMKTKVTTRIKIYKKEGYDYANKSIRYSIASSKESVSFSDAVTYNLVEGKIVKTKLKSDGQFEEKVNKFYNRKKITMPNIKEGSIIEFEYVIRSDNFWTLRDWDFQKDIPVNYSEFKTYVPEYYVYNTNLKGFIYPKKTVDKINRTITFTSAERTGRLATQTNYSTDSVTYIETQTTYVAQNLPAMKEEVFVNNMDNYTASISHELTSVQYPNSPFKNYSTNWEDVAKKIYGFDDFGGELNKTGYFDDDLKVILKGIDKPNEKMDVLFNYVKSNVKWNDYLGFSCDDGVRKAYKDKTGNVAEINLMLTAMLRYAGLDANPVLLSTRDNGIALFPSITAFNYVIVQVTTPDGTYLLDATEKYATPNVLPLRDLNWYGRLIKKDGTSENIDLNPKVNSSENIFLSATINPDATINGKLGKQLTNHEALLFRKKHLETSKENYLEALENENNKIEISEYDRQNEKDLDKPIVETYDFKDTKSTEVIGDKIYISPLLFLTTKENPFKQDKREYPIDFGFPIQTKYIINIDIPQGYVVETLPKPINIALEDKTMALKYIIENSGNRIQIMINEEINAAIVPAEYYEAIKDFFQKMIDKENEKIVLKKN